jgi:hypothetical protein
VRREGVANVSQDNHLAPPGNALLNIGRPARPGEPAGTARTVRKPTTSEPSWGRVLATTVKLWILRARGWRAVAVIAAAAAVTAAALAGGGVFTGTAAPAARARVTSPPSAARAVTRPTASPADVAQAMAAAWIADQLSSDAIIACEPAMCAALQAHGVSAGRLMPLESGSPDPQGAAVVVTPAPASSQLAAYAPALIATFGSGQARMDVRAAEPGGMAAYEAEQRADLAARMNAGSQLLRNNRIHFTAQDAAQLRAGEVDARLLATLAALSSQYSFTVAAFGDASPGVAVVYRAVTITGDGRNGAAGLGPALALVRAQVPPYLPAQASIVHPAALIIEFAAPSPMGLLTAVLDVTQR